MNKWKRMKVNESVGKRIKEWKRMKEWKRIKEFNIMKE